MFSFFIPFQIQDRARSYPILLPAPRSCLQNSGAAHHWFFFYLPFHTLIAMSGFAVVRTKHHQRRPPPTVDRILAHRLLFFVALAKAPIRFQNPGAGENFLLYKFAPSPLHKDHKKFGISITWFKIAAPSTSQPMAPISAHVKRGIIKNGRIFCLSTVQIIYRLFSCYAQCFCCRIQVQAMAGLILHFGKQICLAF